MGSYIPSTPAERAAMLQEIGLSDSMALFRDVPDSVLLKEKVAIPDGLSEMEVLEKLQAMAGRNTVFSVILRGAGAYDHFIPSIVQTVTSKEEFLTAYTPYQAEISQGVLQSIFEYQTMICELTGMDVSNASLYDGASAAGEAAMMCIDRKRTHVYAADTAHPDVLATLKTYCWGRDIPFHIIPQRDGLVDLEALKALPVDDTACFYFQQPNFYGLIERAEDIVSLTHAAGAKAVMGANPIALGLMKTPGECGADIAVGEGQPLGMPLSFGGPYLGFMATRKAMTRLLPGRIVGETQDAKGRRAYVLTLQAREQHIRREKAGSNVCTNQALCAMRSAVYMAAMGPEGLRQVAELCYHKAHYFAQKLCEIPGFALVHEGAFFHEFLTTTPMAPDRLEQALAEHGVLSGLPYQGGMLWCVTEKLSRAVLDDTLQLIREVCRP